MGHRGAGALLVCALHIHYINHSDYFYLAICIAPGVIVSYVGHMLSHPARRALPLIGV